jgi:hypothetical protein
VGRAELAARAVVAAEDHGAAELTAGHVEHLRGVVEDGVGGDEAERPAHELDDGAQAVHRRADRQPAKPFSEIGVSMMRRGPNSSSMPLADLVRAVVLGDFLAQQKTRLSRRISSLIASRRASRNWMGSWSSGGRPRAA